MNQVSKTVELNI